MRKDDLVKRLTWYYPLERFHAGVTFPVLLLALLNNRWLDILWLSYGLLVMIFILFQGQHYWKLKLLRLTGQPVDQDKNLRLFKKARLINAYLIAGMPLVLAWQLYISGFAFKPGHWMGWALAANGFAILEYLNYYHRQLSIDKVADLRYVMTHRKLKVASLAKDLRENRL